MRVGLSLLTLAPGEMGGSEVYARSLARELARRGAVDVTAFVPPVAPDAGEGLPTVVVPGAPSRTTRGSRLLGMARGAAWPGAMGEAFRGLDVVHYPLTVPVPRVAARTAVTLHDVQHLDLPGMFSRAERTYRRFAYDRAARRADAVIAISAFVRERALERIGLDPARVHVAPLGVDHDVFRPGTGEREPFLLYPARPWPHKNHARLLEAFARLRRDRPELRLVLTGGGHAGTLAAPGVEVRGTVTLEELAGLCRRAACLVFPSLYEGFGLPPLEAMASGCPVAASNAGSLPEVCGDAAVLFDPRDPEAIADGVASALARADELARLGIERASRFTWTATAAAHEDVYRSLSTRS